MAFAGTEQQRLESMAGDIARQYGLDPAIFKGMIKAESGWDTYAQAAGKNTHAAGLGQLQPATAERFGVRRVFSASENLTGAAKYLANLRDRYRGDYRRALAAYHLGEGNVSSSAPIPREAENRLAQIYTYAGQYGYGVSQADTDIMLRIFDTAAKPIDLTQDTTAKQTEKLKAFSLWGTIREAGFPALLLLIGAFLVASSSWGLVNRGLPNVKLPA